MQSNEDIEVLSGQLVAQNMMLQILLGQYVLQSSDSGVELRNALTAGLSAIRGNPNMTDRELFGSEQTLEDAIDTIDRIRAGTQN